MYHLRYNEATWAPWSGKSMATGLFLQQRVPILYRIIHELPCIIISWLRVGWFAEDFCSRECESLTNHPQVPKSVFHSNKLSYHYIFYVLWCGIEHMKNDKNCPNPFLFRYCWLECQLNAMLWRNANRYCDDSLTDCLQKVSTLVACVFLSSSVIESDLRHIHCLTCKNIDPL